MHQVLNLAEFGERAVSLHIYSGLFDTCGIHSLEPGTYCDVPWFYTSEYGKLCPGEPARHRPEAHLPVGQAGGQGRPAD